MARVKLGEVAHEYKAVCKGSKDGLPVVGLEHLTPQDLTLSAWDAGKDNTFTKMFRKGQVLFGRRRAYLKKAAIAPFDGICSGDITVIEAMPERILPDLLPFIIQNDSLFDYAVGKSAGSLSPRVKWEHLKDYEFELPSLDRQRTLAGILWAAHEAKEAYKKLLAATDDLVKSQFIELFGDMKSNPLGWRESTVGRECFYIKDGPHKSPAYVEDGTGIPFISTRNVVNGDGIDWSTAKYISEDDYQQCIKKCNPEKGDILYSKGGTTGIAKLVNTDKRFANWVHLAVLKFGCQLEGRFFECMLNSDYCYRQSQELTKGIANRDFVLSAIAQVRIIVPPVERQKQYVAFVEQLDKSKVAIRQSLKKLELAYHALMQEYFG